MFGRIFLQILLHPRRRFLLHHVEMEPLSGRECGFDSRGFLRFKTVICRHPWHVYISLRQSRRPLNCALEVLLQQHQHHHDQQEQQEQQAALPKTVFVAGIFFYLNLARWVGGGLTEASQASLAPMLIDGCHAMVWGLVVGRVGGLGG